MLHLKERSWRQTGVIPYWGSCLGPDCLHVGCQSTLVMVSHCQLITVSQCHSVTIWQCQSDHPMTAYLSLAPPQSSSVSDRELSSVSDGGWTVGWWVAGGGGGGGEAPGLPRPSLSRQTEYQDLTLPPVNFLLSSPLLLPGQ